MARAEDWPWSSARAHLAGGNDLLCAAAPLLERAKRWLGQSWSALLAAADEEAALERFRRHAGTGRPLGDAAFLARLEAATGRRPRPGRPGRPRKKPVEDGTAA